MAKFNNSRFFFQVEWYFKDRPINYSNRNLKTRRAEETHFLMINSVRQDDFGDYSCRATNSLGESEELIELSGTPNLAVIKADSKRLNSNTYNFIWEADSWERIVDYQFWFRPTNTRGKVCSSFQKNMSVLSETAIFNVFNIIFKKFHQI